MPDGMRIPRPIRVILWIARCTAMSPFIDWYLRRDARLRAPDRNAAARLSGCARVPAARWNRVSPAGNESTKAKRLESTRVLWDPDYMPGVGEVQDPPRPYPAIALVGAEQLPGYQDSDHRV